LGERLTVYRQNGGRNAEKPITQNVAMLLLTHIPGSEIK